MEIKELIARLEAADGADRELDVCLVLTFDAKTTGATAASDERRGWYTYSRVFADGAEEHGTDPAPHYTASIDAALALVEWKLPGRSIGLLADILGPDLAWPTRAHLPLAIILALLRALSREPSP